MIPAQVWGSNSDRYGHFLEWLEVMCRGCRHAIVFAKDEPPSCRLALDSQALSQPDKELPEWTTEAVPPEAAAACRDAGLEEAWCTRRVDRARRSDAGLRRGPRPIPGQAVLLDG